MERKHDSYRRVASAGVLWLFGTVTAGIGVEHALSGEPLRSIFLGVLPPFLVSVGVLVAGVVLYRRGTAERWLWRIDAWVLAGALVGGVGGLLVFNYEQSHGGAFVHANYVTLNSVIGGGGIGAVVGYYDVRGKTRAAALETTNDILDTVRRINREIATTDDREALERVVCETISSADPYVFAWVGALEGDDVVPRASAGVDEGYLDEVTITVRDGDTARGPAGTAVRTGEPQVMQNVLEAPEFEPWREEALERGFQSSMAIPLVRGDRTYGLLNIYADRPGAFEGRERAVLEELGGTVTEAIDAIELRASQTELLDSMDDAAFGFSLESGSMVAVNQAAVDRLGYTETELLSMTLADIESERDEAEFEELYARLDEEGGLVFESVHETKSGEGIPAEVNASRVQYRGEETVLAIARDVSRRKRRERSLRTYRQAIEHAGHSIYITDPEGNIEYANPAFEEQTGFSREEVIGEDPSILQSGSYGDDFYDDLWETISNGDVWHHEEMVDRRKDGTEYYVDQTIAPITDDSGAVERYVAVSRDVTELTEYQQTLEERTKQLELLNRIVRHDIRNDMQIVLGRGQLLEQYVSPEGEASLTTVLEHAEHVVELTRTVRELMDTLLADEELTRQSVALDRVLESEISEVDSGDSAAIVRVGELPATDVCANEMLASVFRNLLKNAIQHNDAEVPEVTVRATESEETVTVHVADNGPGVPDARKRVVFGKGEKGLESSGTGLGLYLVQTLVDQYDGDVWVEDNDPRGSVFNVRLQKRTGTTV